METYTPPALLPRRASRFAILGLKVLTTIFQIISLFIHVTNISPPDIDGNKFHFYTFVPYRYMTAALVIGIAYSVFQIGVTIIRFKRENHGNLLLNFYGDKVISVVLASGAVAGFVMTAELQRLEAKANGKVNSGYYYRNYYRRSHAADGFALLGFICTFILSVLSSYALPKRV